MSVVRSNLLILVARTCSPIVTVANIHIAYQVARLSKIDNPRRWNTDVGHHVLVFHTMLTRKYRRCVPPDRIALLYCPEGDSKAVGWDQVVPFTIYHWDRHSGTNSSMPEGWFSVSFRCYGRKRQVLNDQALSWWRETVCREDIIRTQVWSSCGEEIDTCVA